MAPYAPNLPRLKLVRSAVATPDLCEMHPSLLFALHGCRDGGDEPDLRPSALRTLVAGLWEHEVLELVVRLDRNAETAVTVHVGLAQSRASAASHTRDVMANALAGALPRWQLTPAPLEAWPELPQLRTVLRPACLLAGGPGDAAPTWLPMPLKLPGWALTTPFDEPLANAPLVLRYRFRSARLTDGMRQTLHRRLLELRRGALHMYRSGAPEAPYLHDLRMETAALDLWPVLLQVGAGWTFELELRCDDALSPYALRRLQQDIFAEHPCIALPDGDVEGARLQPCWPLVAEQGLPGAFPSLPVLLAASVRSVPRVGAQPPGGPGLHVGETASGRPVVLPDCFLTQHALVLGGSGTGKSNLLRQLAMEQMSSDGGLVYIDPHGHDFDVLLHAVPKGRAKDVVVVDLDADDASVALNPMQDTHGNPALRRLVASRLGDLIDQQLEVPASRGPRVAQLTRDVMEIAMLHPLGGTPADAERLLIDPDFCGYLLGKEANGGRLRSSWAKLRQTSGESGFDTWMSYLQARFSVFTRSMPLLATLSRPSTTDLGQCLRRNAIILVRMPQGIMSESDTRLLGAVLLAQIQFAAMSDAAPRVGRPFLVITDEFGLFATKSAPAQFAQLRKFGVALCVASQSLASLRAAGDEVCAAVLGNSASKVLFRLAPREAIELDEYTAPEYPAREIARLPNYQAVLSLAASGSPPVRFVAARAQPKGPCADPARVRQLSGTAHGTPLDKTVEYLRVRHPHLGPF